MEDDNTYKAEVWDYLIETGIATEEMLQLATNLCGYSDETMDSVIYALTGYRSLDQLRDAEEAEA